MTDFQPSGFSKLWHAFDWQNSREMLTLLILRVLNLGLAYILVVMLSKWLTPADYVLFEKITFFLMLGNIVLSPLLISMWHGQVEHLVAEGLSLLVGLSLAAAFLLYLSDDSMLPIVAATGGIYFFCYYLKTTLYTHLITLKRYYAAYGTNTLFYLGYMAAISLFAAGIYLHSPLLSFLLFPSIVLAFGFIVHWKRLLAGVTGEAVKGQKQRFREVFSIVLIMHNVMTLMLMSGERFVLDSYSSIAVEPLAAYLYLATIISAFQSLGLSVAEWLRPQVFGNLSEGKPLTKLYTQSIPLLAVMFAVFLLAGWPVLQFISSEKVALFPFFPHFTVLALANLFIVLAFFFDLQIVYRKKYVFLLAASTSGVIAKLIGYWLWDGLNDLSGVVYANLLGTVVFLLGTLIFVHISRRS